MNPNSPELDFIVKWHSPLCDDLPSLKNHTSVFYKNNIVIFGGYDGEYHLNKLYMYDVKLDECKIIPTTGDIPKGRNGHTATLVKNKMYMIGGWLGLGSLASDEVYELDLDELIWKKIDAEPSIGPSNMHTADLYGEEIIIFRGGNGREYLNDLLSFNYVTKQTKLFDTTGKPPHVRANHSSAIVGNNLYIFGGWSGSKRLNDLHFINLETFSWTMIEIFGNKPSPRAGMPLLHYKGCLMLFGGSGMNSSYLNDLYFYNIQYNLWFIPNRIYNIENSPCERAGHTAVIEDRFVYIYGGGRNTSSSISTIHVLEIDYEPQFKSLKITAKEKMTENLKKFYNNPFLSDVTLTFRNSDVCFYGHKFILSLLCEKFKAMFSCGFEESVNQEIRLEFNWKHFNLILKYLYYQELESEELLQIYSKWSLPDFIAILKISDEFLIENVKNWSQSKIAKLIDTNNFFFVLNYAKKYCADYLIEYCNWFHRQNKKSILVSSIELTISDLSIYSDKDNYDNN